VFASIPSPPQSGFGIGPFEVHVYGLMYVVGLALAILITARRWQAQGGSRQLVYDVALWAFPAGLIGGRLYFDLTSSGEVPPHWWGPFAVWDGGMGIWGGIALGTLVGVWRLRRAGVSVAAFMDAAAPALLVGQAVGRIGNYFNQELFGGPTSLPWALQISPGHRPAGYESFATFHPTFLYELIWNLALAAFLVWLGRHRRVRPPGLFALYVAGYSAFRIFEESLRVDPAHHILGLRLNFFVACALTVAGIVWFLASQQRGAERGHVGKRTTALIAVGWAALVLFGCGQSSDPPKLTADASAGGQAGALARHDPGPPPDPKHLDVAPSNPPSLAARERAAAKRGGVVVVPGEPAPPPGYGESAGKAGGSSSQPPPASAGSNGSYTPPKTPGGEPITPRTLKGLGPQANNPSAILLDGIALAPPAAPEKIKRAISAANSIVGRPYIWGGGHASWYSRGYDCSGAVSFALGGGGFLGTPLDSTQLESWGAPGPGKWLTVYANATHAYVVIASLRFDTVGDARGTGPRWHPALAYPEGFVERHAPGF
jgi:prolipoprotein diacylglyceryl transferase